MRSWRFSAVWCYCSLKRSAFTQISCRWFPPESGSRTSCSEATAELFKHNRTSSRRQRSSQNCVIANVIFHGINYMLNFSTCQSRFNSIIKFKGNNQRKCRLFVTQSTHDIVRRGVLGIYRCTFCFLQRNNQRALHILTNSPISH